MKFRSLLLIILFTLISLPFIAQKNNFNRYTIKSGLPQNTVYKIFQDSKGYIWFGTDGGGVSKFNGTNHTYFTKNNGLAGNVVRDIIEDNQGNLLFATDAGLSIYDGKKFTTIDTDNGLSSNITLKLFNDSEQRIWLGTSGGGLNLISYQDTIQVTNFTTQNGLNSDIVFSITEDDFNRIWLGYIGGNPQIITYQKNKLNIKEINTAFNYDLSAIFCSTKDDEGNIWFGSIRNGVYKFENISPNSNPSIISYSILNGLKDNYILDICKVNSTIWIATNDGGVQYLNQNKFNYINTKDGLPSNQVLDIFSDKEKNLWFSCMGEGVLKLNGFEFSHFSKDDNLLSNRISHIKKNPLDSTLWVSSYDNGIQVLKIEDQELIEQNKILSDNSYYNTIKTFDFDAHNNAWIGTQNGLVIWNDGIIATVSAEDELAGNQVNTILCAKSGWTWIGTSSGLSWYNGEMFGVFSEENGFINNEIQTIIESTDETIWIGTLGGLAKYKDNAITTYDNEEGLTNLKVHSLIEAVNGNLIIGTYGGGLYYFNKSIDSLPIQQLDLKLTSNNIYSLAFENDTTLIVGTDKGFDKVVFGNNFSVYKTQHYTENNGFLSIENNLNSIYNDKSTNTIYFGTVNGITLYKPFMEQKDIQSPPILLENIKLFNQDVNWNEYGEVDNSNIPIGLNLPFKQNFISFTFSTIYFKNPKNITYRYQLTGFNDEWYDSKNNEIVFQGLEPNNYSLKVKAITENGIESNVYEFNFIITPPFYKTWWFYIICVIFIASTIIIYIRLNLKRLRKEKLILEKTVRERTKEIVEQKDIIEEKNKEITDSITYAQRIQHAILPDEEKLNSYLKDYFVLFNPKDIVSGDFYWANRKDNKFYFMAADCTGHGVPGAIMSVIGHTSLETTLKTSDNLGAGEFLDLLTTNMVNTLVQSKQHSIKDGMDASLCIYDIEKNTLEYAGANNPLYIVRPIETKFDAILNEETLVLNTERHNLFEFKANKQPIGVFEHRVRFNTHTINLQPNDTIYMFSDGFADQFGGPKGKKYKYKPFKQFLLDIQKEPLAIQKEKLNSELITWINPKETNIVYEQIDDVLIFGIRF
ncbi:MAG: SpoIIE family protein phosphatase [Flavobacteriales bacterium]|nr:SpoIIE family protein phosphatase [Flavobacteriales bacterium]